MVEVGWGDGGTGLLAVGVGVSRKPGIVIQLCDLRASPHLSPLTLQPPNPLLPPFGSHLERLVSLLLAEARKLETVKLKNCQVGRVIQ